MTSKYRQVNTFESFRSQLYNVNADTFGNIALELFRFQATENPLYRDYVHHLGVSIENVNTLLEIPFLPISFFKHHTIKTGAWPTQTIFSSSGTTGQVTSKHHLADLSFYLEHSRRCFTHFFGPVTDYDFFALLPSYLERQGSSLVAMIDHLMQESHSPLSGFYLHDYDKLLRDLNSDRSEGRKTMLWGVTFALLQLAELRPDLRDVIIIETGGMKGKGKELVRRELHQVLKEGLNMKAIYSEYGMTELLSQAYSLGEDRFFCPPWMKIISRDITDPLHKGLLRETSGINVIDLANFHSISFIETEDLGKVYEDGSFEVLGRMDNSDMRGCNLMVQ